MNKQRAIEKITHQLRRSAGGELNYKYEQWAEVLYDRLLDLMRREFPEEALRMVIGTVVRRAREDIPYSVSKEQPIIDYWTKQLIFDINLLWESGPQIAIPGHPLHVEGEYCEVCTSRRKREIGRREYDVSCREGGVILGAIYGKPLDRRKIHHS